MNCSIGVALVVGLMAAAPPMPSKITLHKGEQKAFTVGCALARLAVDASPATLQRLAVGDASTFDVKTLGNNEVLLVGAEQGRSTLLGWCSNGKRFAVLVEVLAEPLPGPPQKVKVKKTEEAATLVDAAGARQTQVAIVEFAGDLREVTQVQSTDGGLRLEGLDAAGRKVTITATPYRPRQRGKADGGQAGDGGGPRDG